MTDLTVITFDKLPITIQALRINGKKVSIAVFNQFPVIDLLKIPTENWWGVVNKRVPNEECGYWMIGHVDGVIYRGDTQIKNNQALTKMLSKIALDIVKVAKGSDRNRYDIAGGFGYFDRYGGSFIQIQHPEYIEGDYCKEEAIHRLKLLESYLKVIAKQPQIYISV